MDFVSAWNAAAIGMTIAASSGAAEPPKDNVRQWANWRRLNFTGTVVEKEPGRLAVRVEDDKGSLVFPIEEIDGCSLTFPTPDLSTAEKIALTKVEDDADTINRGNIRKLYRHLIISQLWNEIQLLKLHSDTNTVPAAPAERALRFPTLSALAQASGATLAQVATAAENRLAARVQKASDIHAKLLLAHDAIRAATTPEAKLAAAEVIWEG